MLDHATSSALLKYIAVRSVQLASSGHPGAPLGCADIMTVLWRKWLNINPDRPEWINRDRFVLSNGHASAMLYPL
jgi:transketolase